MIQIRRNIFETNSSSTHSLSMTNEHISDAEFDDLVFEKTYVIKPFRSDEVDDTMELSNVKDKLRYFLTLYYQDWYYNDSGSIGEQFMRLLKKTFPNAVFSLEFRHEYVFEDGEYFFHGCCGYPAECEKMTDEYILKKFMLYGTINFGDRDREEYSDKVSHIHYNKDLWDITWSG